MPNDECNSSRAKAKSKWRKIRSEKGLYQYEPSGVYFGRLRKGGRLHRESLRTRDLATAKRLLRDLKARLERVDARYGNVSFLTWLEQHYLPTLKGSASTLAGKRQHVERLRRTWLAARSQPMRDLRGSDVERWLTEQYGRWSSGFYNSALMLVRDALAMAVRDHALCESPASGLKYRKRTKPVRLTPSWAEFCMITQDVRSQKFAPDAEASGDLLEAMGLLGLGQAELAGMKREHVDLQSGRILVFRRKTSQTFCIPVYPQARQLIERLCSGKKHHQRLFAVSQARRALQHSCRRLSFPAYTHRSLRRMFITRCLELGIDVQSIARFQGHKDGGKLILDTYGFVSDAHSRRMAAMLVSEQPENIVPMQAQESA